MCKLMKAGVVLYSRPGLHAKVIVVDSSKPKTIVGSANASVTSVDKKAEVVIVLDDPEAVADVRSAIAGWKVGVAPLTPQWLARVEKLPRTRRSPTTTFRPGNEQPITDPNKRLWLLDYVWDDRTWEDDVSRAVSKAAQDTGYLVEAFPLRRYRSMYGQIAVGDSVLFIPYPSTATRPRANAPIDEPWLVVDKLPRNEVATSSWRAVDIGPRSGGTTCEIRSCVLGRTPMATFWTLPAELQCLRASTIKTVAPRRHVRVEPLDPPTRKLRASRVRLGDCV